jgi:hypothetical protein
LVTGRNLSYNVAHTVQMGLWEGKTNPRWVKKE